MKDEPIKNKELFESLSDSDKKIHIREMYYELKNSRNALQPTYVVIKEETFNKLNKLYENQLSRLRDISYKYLNMKLEDVLRKEL